MKIDKEILATWLAILFYCFATWATIIYVIVLNIEAMK